eukprot:6172017-Pleurochrysis_carterae.AAC.1
MVHSVVDHNSDFLHIRTYDCNSRLFAARAGSGSGSLKIAGQQKISHLGVQKSMQFLRGPSLAYNQSEDHWHFSHAWHFVTSTIRSTQLPGSCARHAQAQGRWQYHASDDRDGKGPLRWQKSGLCAWGALLRTSPIILSVSLTRNRPDARPS